MKILHLLKSGTFSGAENIALMLMDLFCEDETIYASPEGSIREFVTQRNHQYYPLKNTNISEVKKVIKELKPDIVHAHDFSMATNAALAFTNTPIIAHLHNNPPWLKSINSKSVGFALALPFIKQVISVSKSIEDEYCFKSLLKGKNTIVGNIVNLNYVQKQAKAFQVDKRFDLIFLGRLTEPKNPMAFCSIVNEIRNTKDSSIQAVMVGDGDLRVDIEEYVKKNNLENNISLVGFQKNPYPYIEASKILVIPSKWEGFGLVAVEALSLGKPVICSGAGGLQDIIKDGNGIICKCNSEYINAINELLEYSDKYQQMSEKASTVASIYGDLDCYKDRILQIYHKV